MKVTDEYNISTSIPREEGDKKRGEYQDVVLRLRWENLAKKIIEATSL